MISFYCVQRYKKLMKRVLFSRPNVKFLIKTMRVCPDGHTRNTVSIDFPPIVILLWSGQRHFEFRNIRK